MTINKDLLKILVCVESKKPLLLIENTLVSIDPQTRRRYRIENDIPVMLIDESEILSQEEWREIMKKKNQEV